jgi:hypothetical protein
MAKANATSNVPQSWVDFGKRTGVADSAARVDTVWAMDLCPSLGNPDVDRKNQIPKDTLDEIKQGLAIHYAESVKPQRTFAVVDGNIVLLDAKQLAKHEGEKRLLDVHIAYGIDQSTFNYLRENDKTWYDMLMEERRGFSSYTSNLIGDVIKKARKIWDARKGIVRTRVSALALDVAEQKMLDEILTRHRNSTAKGNDPYANVELTKRRIDAWFATK